MDSFSNLIEFSIALAGFTSIVVVFAHKDEKWKRFDRFRITNALMGSIGASFLASIPGGLNLLNLEETTMWKIEGAIVAAYLVIFLFSVLRRRSKELTFKDREQIPRRAIAMILGVNFTYVGLLLLSLFDLIAIEIQALSYFGILLLLLSSVFAFVRMIFYRPIDEK